MLLFPQSPLPLWEIRNGDRLERTTSKACLPWDYKDSYHGLPWNIRSIGKNNRNYGYAQKYNDDSLLCSFIGAHDAKERNISKECIKCTLGKRGKKMNKRKTGFLVGTMVLASLAVIKWICLNQRLEDLEEVSERSNCFSK